MERHSPMRITSNGSLRLAGVNYTGETFKRILLRSLTWRIGGVITAVVVTWWLTGDAKLGVEIGIVYNLIRYFSHLLHDVAWTRYIRFGTGVKNDGRTTENTSRTIHAGQH